MFGVSELTKTGEVLFKSAGLEKRGKVQKRRGMTAIKGREDVTK